MDWQACNSHSHAENACTNTSGTILTTFKTSKELNIIVLDQNSIDSWKDKRFQNQGIWNVERVFKLKGNCKREKSFLVVLEILKMHEQ